MRSRCEAAFLLVAAMSLATLREQSAALETKPKGAQSVRAVDSSMNIELVIADRDGVGLDCSVDVGPGMIVLHSRGGAVVGRQCQKPRLQ